MALEAQDRSEELVQGHRSDFVGKPSIAQARKKGKGEGRIVVEFPFSFTKEFLREKSDQHGQNYIDGVDYLRELVKQYNQGDIDLGDLYNLTIDHGQGQLRIEAAK